MPISVWLDQDPGHDDAIATLLAVSSPALKLVGISTVHGNGSLAHTTLNAAKVLCSFADPKVAKEVPVYSGTSKPLLRPVKHDPEIHGESGLGGVEGLLEETEPAVKEKLDQSNGKNAVLAIAEAARAMPGGEGDEGRLALVATGTLTNIALFCAMFPELVRDKISQIVIMGGAEGRGNRSPTAEFNILCDPEAAAIVFDSEVKVVMMPLNVTHTALFTPADNDRLLQRIPNSPYSTGAKTQLRHTLSTLLMFFAATYEKVFGFTEGPPVHDPLCIAYLSHPHLFQGTRYRVDVETSGKYTAGTTSVDLWEYRKDELTAMEKDPDSRESWGKYGKNVWLAEKMDVAGFWQVFQDAVDHLDTVSPLNTKN
ncbi:uridine nucleosidase [Meredithblackwellia eburnea MCA 4105]